jgi:hypothetical protein
MPSQMLNLVSLTGADDNVNPQELRDLYLEHPFLEWALLYVPHNEGAPRNPSLEWRHQYWSGLKMPTAVHWCGDLAWEKLSSDQWPKDLALAHRWQLNINARKFTVTETEYHYLVSKSLDHVEHVILQYHEFSQQAIEEWFARYPYSHDRVHVLLDFSRGKGTPMTSMQSPSWLEPHYVGFAGGLHPGNVYDIGQTIGSLRQTPYWIDMESGIRTDNMLDLTKCKDVLEASGKLIG